MSILKKVLTAATAAAMLTGAAFADARSEAFVEKNANAVLNTLNNPSLSDSERTELFSEYMEKFADIDKIARFALGPYGRGLPKEDFTRYFDAFRTYAMAVYEVQLDQFRGEEVDVINSFDRREDGSDSVVVTKVRSEKTGEDLFIEWRVLKQRDEDFYKVRDVALNLDGTKIWLAQEQQAQFKSLLENNDGDIDVLITRINEMTSKLLAEKAAGIETSLNENKF